MSELTIEIDGDTPDDRTYDVYDPRDVDQLSNKLHQLIHKMNSIYELDDAACHASDVPAVAALLEFAAPRIPEFQRIMAKELAEGDDIVRKSVDCDSQEAAIAYCDWLADLLIYVLSEARRANLPILQLAAIAMVSNFTKLGEDGKPIKDADNKVVKGPNFVPPEEAMLNYMGERYIHWACLQMKKVLADE